MPPRGVPRSRKRGKHVASSSSQPPPSSPPPPQPTSPTSPTSSTLPSPIHSYFRSAVMLTNFQNLFKKKKVITGRSVKFDDFFEHGILHLFQACKLVDLMALNLPTYPRLVQEFYANLTLEDYVLYSRVNKVDIKLSALDFAEFLKLPVAGVRIAHHTTQTFKKYPEGHSLDTLSLALHGVAINNPHNENIHAFTLQAQIIAKIIFHNLVPKLGEFDRARGCVPILIYCIMSGIPVSFPKLILDQMTSKNLATSPRSLPFGMILTSLFLHLKIPLDNQLEVIPPPRALDSTFLTRKSSHPSIASGETTPHPPTEPGSTSSAPASSVDLSSAFISQYHIDQTEIAAGMRYQQDMLVEMYRLQSFELPSQTTQSHLLPFEGPPFTPWVDPTVAPDPVQSDDD